MKSKQSSSVDTSGSISDFSPGASIRSGQVPQLTKLEELASAIEQISQEQENSKEIENPEELFSPLEFKLDLSMIPQTTVKTEEFYNLVLQHYLEKQQKPTQFLTKDNKGYDGEERMRFLNWLIEITNSYKMNYSTFFIICSILDEFQKKTQKITRDNLYLTGLSCMYLASKFNDVIPLRIDQAIYISHDRFDRNKIFKKELEIFECLDHQLNFSNSFLFLTLLLRLYLSKVKDKGDDIIEIAYFTLKVCCFDYGLQSKYTQSLISAGCLTYALMLVNSDNQGRVKGHIITSLLHLLENSNVVKDEQILSVGEDIEGLMERYFIDTEFRGKIKNLIDYNLIQTNLVKSYLEIKNQDL
ncbi:unnamed protein product [Paramecium octaurelia]|uniref:Cyclin-like domain-containing protein n=1 Tax=Paramecium octaurelia TaxID=43137 RepID=A0A8S1V6D0_PAROT|nr:unnamed protein product [Paramecium octaurelia]